MSGAATAGSYILSDVLELTPCTLCWYQRVMMFPLPLILGAAVLRKDKAAYIYALPLALLGLLIAGYHSLLQWGVISEGAVTSCSIDGPSCAKPEFLLLGFITIPFASFVSFAAVTGLMLTAQRAYNKKVISDAAKGVFLRMLVGLVSASLIAMYLAKEFLTKEL